MSKTMLLVIAGVVVGVNVVELSWTASANAATTVHEHAAIGFYTPKSDIVYATPGQCMSHGDDCQVTQQYACFTAHEITANVNGEYCRRTYGECSSFRDGALQARDLTHVSECSVYRFTP